MPDAMGAPCLSSNVGPLAVHEGKSSHHFRGSRCYRNLLRYLWTARCLWPLSLLAHSWRRCVLFPAGFGSPVSDFGGPGGSWLRVQASSRTSRHSHRDGNGAVVFWFIAPLQLDEIAMKIWSNKPASGNAEIAPQLAIGCRWPGVPEPER